MSKLYKALGLMSGTSLDGIDIAMLETDGENTVQRGPSATFGYRAAQQELLKQCLADAVVMGQRDERPGCLAEAEKELTQWHSAAVRSFCQSANIDLGQIDIIGFHGQTVLHRPEQRLTVQLGDGAAMAADLGVAVAYDLRAADVAAGGQGAPLVPVYHRALAAGLAMRPVAFVNIGGVANVSWIGGDGTMLAFDTGPGNALLNDWAFQHLGTTQDTDGALAAQGKVDQAVLARALDLPYFKQPPPKSLDRNSFSGLSLAGLSPADGAATLAAFTRESIFKVRDWVPEPPAAFVVCGGGRHNPAIMNSFPDRRQLFLTAEEAGFDGDAMEAEAWAYLAVRSLRGLPITFPGTTRAPMPMTGGIIARP